MSEPSSLKEMFQGMVPQSISLCSGKVTSTSPLAVQISNRSKMVATGITLACPKRLTDYTVYMTVDHVTGEHTHTHTITDTYTGGGSASNETHSHSYKGKKAFLVHDALNVGEEVYLLNFNNGEMYYILDRKG